MWIIYVLGYLFLWIIVSVALKILQNKTNMFDFDNTVYVLGFMWWLSIPTGILALICFGVYWSTIELTQLIEEKFNI